MYAYPQPSETRTHNHTNTHTMVSGQWMHQVELAGFVGQVQYNRLCHRYFEDGSAMSRPLDKGRFESYQRTAIVGITYH